MKLYEIANEFQEIFNSINENGEIDDKALSKLNEMQMAMEDKAIALSLYIKNIDAESVAIESALSAMKDRKQKLDKKMMQLENYLQSNMERCGILQIQSSPYFTIKLKKNPVSVDVFDEESLPSEYIRKRLVVSFDRTKIKTDIENGVVVPGASLKQNMRLEIK